MAGCNCFLRTLHDSEPSRRGICWRLSLGALIQLPHGERCPMTPVKFWPKRTKTQQHTLHHHSQLSPFPTAKDREPWQTAPCHGPRKGLCPWGCVCTGIILIWKNVCFPLYALWITNRHSDPGWCLNNTEVCLLGTRMFPHQAEALFAQQRLQHFWALWSLPFCWQQSNSVSALHCVYLFSERLYTYISGHRESQKAFYTKSYCI